VSPSVSRHRAMHNRLQLLDRLAAQDTPQGPDALRAGLRMLCGSLEAAHAHLDVAGADGSRGISLLEFVGGLALLGLDAVTLCGCGEREAFHRMDLDCDGQLGLWDVVAPETPLSKSDQRSNACTQQDKTSADAVVDRWVLFARCVAFSAWFDTPRHLRRRERQKSTSQEQDESICAQELAASAAFRTRNAAYRAEVAADSAISLGRHGVNAVEAKAAELAATRACPSSDLQAACSSNGASPVDVTTAASNNRDQCRVTGAAAMMAAVVAAGGGTTSRRYNALQARLDELRRCWEPNQSDAEASLEELRHEFELHAGANFRGEALLTRPGFFQFLGGEFPPPQTADHLSLQRLTYKQAGRVYDDVLALQVGRSPAEGTALSKGLTFASFIAALHGIALVVGLHFRHLVDDAFDTFCNVNSMHH